MDDEKVPGQKTVSGVVDARHIPLVELAQMDNMTALRRVIPQVNTIKPPTATFDASL